MVERNWRIGQRIVEEEQNGETRAEYGKHIIEVASAALTEEFGKGFSETNIEKFISFLSPVYTFWAFCLFYSEKSRIFAITIKL